MKTSIRTPLFSLNAKRLAFTALFLSLFSQTGFAQTRVVVNPGLEFGMPNGTVNQLDANFGFGATFDAGAPVTCHGIHHTLHRQVLVLPVVPETVTLLKYGVQDSTESMLHRELTLLS